MVTIIVGADSMATQFFVPINGNATLRCDVEAEPGISFARIDAISDGNRTVLEELELVEPGQQSSITTRVLPTSLNQTGTVYECVAGNELGNRTDNITLVVQGQSPCVPSDIVTYNTTSSRTERATANNAHSLW